MDTSLKVYAFLLALSTTYCLDKLFASDLDITTLGPAAYYGWTAVGSDGTCVGNEARLSCGSKMMGGLSCFGGGSSLSKTITGLPSHTQLKIKIDVWYLGSNDFQSVQVYIDGILFIDQPPDANPFTIDNSCFQAGNICDQDLECSYTWESAFQPHSGSSANVVITSLLNQDADNESFGVAHLKIYGNCHFSCLTCVSNGPSNCATCSPLTRQLVNANSCPCQDHYYEDNNPQCSPCHASCLTCNGPNQSDCTSCDITKNRNNNLVTPILGTCNCSSGYYQQSPIASSCLPCHVTCQQCSGAQIDQCSVCDPTKKRNNGSNYPIAGQCVCNLGYVESVPISSTCLDCHYSCQLCSLSNNPNKCTSCPNNSFRQDRSAIDSKCPCLLGYYDDSVNTICQPCHYSCSTCSIGGTNLNCDLCASVNRLIVTGFAPSKCTCQSEFYDNGQGSCDQCHISCLTCQGPTSADCLICDSLGGRTVSPVNGYCNCDDRFYENSPISAQCSPCHPTCLQCSGPSKLQCLKCDISLDLNRNQGNSQTTAGACPCTMGFTQKLIISTNCIPCHYRCQTCSTDTANSCLSCDVQKNWYEFPNSSGSCGCITGYYEDTSTKKCERCHFTCQQCKGPNINDCTNCPFSRHLSYQTNKCLCDQGFFQNYPSQTICQGDLCDETCTNCLGEDTTDKFPICFCQSGYFNNGGQCQKCHQTCMECQGEAQNNCRSCYEKTYRVFNNSTLTCDCQSDLYIDVNSTCVKEIDSQGLNMLQVGKVSSGTVGFSSLALVFFNPVIFIQVLDCLQLVQYIRFVDIDFPKLVEDFFDLLGPFDLNFLPIFFPELVDGNMGSPSQFYKQDFKSLFFKNSFQYLFGKRNDQLILKLTKGLQKNSQFKRVIQLMVDELQFGVFLGGIQSGFLNLSIFSMLQIKNSSATQVIEFISYTIALIAFTMLMVFPFIIMILASQFLKILSKKDDESLKIFKKKYGVLLEAFQKESLLQSGFFAIILFRKFMTGVSLVFIYKSPFSVITGLVLMNCLVLYLIRKLNPYQDKWLQFRDIMNEIFLLLLHSICYIFYSRQSVEQSTFNGFAWPFVILILLILLVQFIIIVQEYQELLQKLWSILFQKPTPKPLPPIKQDQFNIDDISEMANCQTGHIFRQQSFIKQETSDSKIENQLTNLDSFNSHHDVELPNKPDIGKNNLDNFVFDFE